MVKDGYKQTDIGIFPDDWEIIELRKPLGQLEAGTSVNSSNDIQSTHRILKTSAVHNGKVDIKESKEVIPSDIPRLKCPVRQGSIIISRMNTPQLVGECGYVSTSHQDVYLPDRLWQTRNVEGYDYRWLNYLLNLSYFRNAVRAAATGTSNSMKNISKEDMYSISIPCPKIKEQNAIAEALSDIDALIDSLEKLIEKKKAIKQGAMQELLTGKRRLEGFAGVWSDQLMGIHTGFQVGFPFSSVFFNVDGNGSRLIKNRDLKSDDLIVYTNEPCSSEFIIDNEDILIGMDGDFLPCRWRKGKAFLNQRVGKLLPKSTLDGIFAFYALQKPLAQLQNGTGATTVKHLSHSDIEKIIIPMPPTTDEQKAVASVLSDLDTDIENSKEHLSKYRMIKAGMMNELLTGRIRLV